MDWTPEELQAIVDEHNLVLFMKGNPNEPQCGFSNRAAQVMQQFSEQVGESFAAVNILSAPRAIPSVCAWSDFPTMPQVFINGELIGGSDIALEMLQDGSMKAMWDEGRSA
jgi:monothiol glutaredoxin